MAAKREAGAVVLFRYGQKHLYGEVVEILEEACMISVVINHRMMRLRVENEDILHWYCLERGKETHA